MAESAEIKKVGWWHERLADWLIANPHRKLSEAAKEFDVSASWISIVKNSDAFKAYFRTRSEDASDQMLVGIREKLVGLAETGLEMLQERLDTDGMLVPHAEVRATTDMALKGLGYSATAKSAPPNASASVAVFVDSDLLAKAREHRSRLYGGAAEGDLLPRPLVQVATTAGDPNVSDD